jgi:hypothetical protein
MGCLYSRLPLRSRLLRRQPPVSLHAHRRPCQCGRRALLLRERRGPVCRHFRNGKGHFGGLRDLKTPGAGADILGRFYAAGYAGEAADAWVGIPVMVVFERSF